MILVSWTFQNTLFFKRYVVCIWATFWAIASYLVPAYPGLLVAGTDHDPFTGQGYNTINGIMCKN